MTAPSLAALGLPDIVGRFAEEESGLIVFSGADAAAVSTSAITLTRHVGDTAGRTAAVFTSGQNTADLLDLRLALRTASDRSNQPKQVRKAVEAAAVGALVSFTLPFSGCPYVLLLNLLQSAEDWKLRGPFDAALYAVVQPAAIQGGMAEEADVFIPVARKKVQE